MAKCKIQYSYYKKLRIIIIDEESQSQNIGLVFSQRKPLALNAFFSDDMDFHLITSIDITF